MRTVFLMNGYSHEYDIRQNKAGGGVSFFIENRLINTRIKYIQLNPIFNYIIVDIDKSELNSRINISIIIVYRPPNTDSSIFIRDMEAMITTLTSENREIYMLGDFNYDTFKKSIIK